METVSTLHSDGHTHYFLHKHLQHYLASRHLALITPADRRTKLIREASIRMAPVLQYLAGSSEEPPPPSTICSWFDPTAILNLESLCPFLASFLDAMHYIHEAPAPQDLGRVIEKVDKSYIPPHSLSLLDCYVIGYCVVNSGLLWRQIELQNCRVDERGMAKMALPRDSTGRVCFSLVVSLNLSHNPISDPGLEHIGRQRGTCVSSTRVPDTYAMTKQTNHNSYCIMALDTDLDIFQIALSPPFPPFLTSPSPLPTLPFSFKPHHVK